MNLLSFIRKNPSSTKVKLFLTDDHAILLGGLLKILEGEPEFEVVGTATNATDTLDAFTQKKIDLLITDYNLPDEDGLSLVRKIKRKYPDTKNPCAKHARRSSPRQRDP